VGCTHMYLISLAPKSRILGTGKVKPHPSSPRAISKHKSPFPQSQTFTSCATTGASSPCVATALSWPDQTAIAYSSSFNESTILPIAFGMIFHSRCLMNVFPIDGIFGEDTSTITAPGSAGTTASTLTTGAGREMHVMGLGRKG